MSEHPDVDATVQSLIYAIDRKIDEVMAERDRLSIACIELQQEINCLRMEPCQLPACVKERERLKAELEKVNLSQPTSDWIKDRDLWKERFHTADNFLTIEKDKFETLQESYAKLDCEFQIDHAEMEAKAEKLAEALKKINRIGLDKSLGQIVGSEHYEKAWLDCVEKAGRAIAEYEKEGYNRP